MSEQTSFDHLLAANESAVRFYVRSLLPGYHGADDVAQEVLLTVWQKRDSFESGTNFKAWAFKIAKFHVLNQRRKLARGNWLIFDEEMMEQIDPEWMAEKFENSRPEEDALEICLKEINEEDRELLHTRYATKTSLETFAEGKGIPPGTIKAKLFRLRSALRGCIESKIASTEQK